MDSSRTVRVESVVRESSRHVTLSFRDAAADGFGPGQFMMVWVPGVDEVPMAVWGGRGGPLKFLVEAKGDCTTALAKKQVGELIGVRGPYGKPFEVRGKRLLIVVGGTGTSPLVPFCERAPRGTKIDVVIGARSRDFVLLKAAYEAAGATVHVSTDDGSMGFHGRAPDLAKQLMDRTAYDDVLTCGPERMMRAVVDECVRRGVLCQASLERWMKCAVGICDACLVDGVRLCRDGPVLPTEVLVGLEDFGRFEREPSGLRRPLH